MVVAVRGSSTDGMAARIRGVALFTHLEKARGDGLSNAVNEVDERRGMQEYIGTRNLD
jgi:hypothetical protein